mgnify:CR=1 FL=1
MLLAYDEGMGRIEFEDSDFKVLTGEEVKTLLNTAVSLIKVAARHAEDMGVYKSEDELEEAYMYFRCVERDTHKFIDKLDKPKYYLFTDKYPAMVLADNCVGVCLTVMESLLCDGTLKHREAITEVVNGKAVRKFHVVYEEPCIMWVSNVKHLAEQYCYDKEQVAATKAYIERLNEIIASNQTEGELAHVF